MSRPLKLSPRVRLAALAVTAALSLAACNSSQTMDTSARARQPLSPQMLSLIAEKDMTPQSPIMIRVFKEEAELEVWKAKTDGDYALLKTYPICRWSGELGPKVKMGDRQAPEGFYTITPGQMNPNSNYYLAINTGFPNAFDRSYGRTGDFLMIHGDCSSAGCYAMTDEQIAEIFSLARDSFAGGQRAFQLQAMPFRMTAENLARHRGNPNMPFWRNLKEGYDHFQVTHRVPKVDVCGRTYVFDAQAPVGATFDPAAACPSYTVAPEIASAVGAKQRADDIKVAELSRSTPVAPVRTGKDGGMNPVFLSHFQTQDGSGERVLVASSTPLPGTIPPTARPPKTDEEVAATTAGTVPPAARPVAAAAPVAVPVPVATSAPAAVATPAPVPVGTQSLATPAADTRVASSEAGSGFSFTKLLSFAGQDKAADKPAEALPAPQQAAAPVPVRPASAVPNPVPVAAQRPGVASTSPAPVPAPQAAVAKPAAMHVASSAPVVAAKPAPAPVPAAGIDAAPADPSLLTGGAPIVTTGAFSAQ